MSFCFSCLRCFTFSDLFRLSGWAVLEKYNAIYILNHHGIYFFILIYTIHIIFFNVDRSVSLIMFAFTDTNFSDLISD